GSVCALRAAGAAAVFMAACAAPRCACATVKEAAQAARQSASGASGRSLAFIVGLRKKRESSGHTLALGVRVSRVVCGVVLRLPGCWPAQQQNVRRDDWLMRISVPRVGRGRPRSAVDDFSFDGAHTAGAEYSGAAGLKKENAGGPAGV